MLLELTNTMSDHDNLFEYLHGFKDRVQQVVIVKNPNGFNTTTTCANNADNIKLFRAAICCHRGGGGPMRQLTQGRPRLGPMPMDSGTGQYVPIQNKEYKLPVYYDCSEIGHFKSDCPKRAKKTFWGQVQKEITGQLGELCNADLDTVGQVPLVILDCKVSISNWTRDIKLLALINSGASFNFMSSLVAQHLACIIRPN